MIRTILTTLFLLGAVFNIDAGEKQRVTYDQNDKDGTLSVLVDGKTAFIYQYASDLDMPHYYPVLSPSGKTMTVQQTKPYPHHRSFWFADRVQLAGERPVTFYAALYTSKNGKENPTPPYKDHIRHVKFTFEPKAGEKPTIDSKLIWEMDNNKPVLDEDRVMQITPLDGGEYFLDVTFTLTAAYGDVKFVSDAVHYAWPYIRMHSDFSGKSGGMLTSSEGGKKQAATHGKVATWMDYSNTIDGVAEGLTIFSHPSNGHPHKWLTRDYGTFGPRRVDAKSGKPFTIKKGESIKQRVGILVHKGDVSGGKVAERYKQYAADKPVTHRLKRAPRSCFESMSLDGAMPKIKKSAP